MSETATSQTAAPERHRLIEITVNKHPVEVEEKVLTGLEIKEAELGKDHPTVAASLSILALLEGAQGRWEASARHLGQALQISYRHRCESST